MSENKNKTEQDPKKAALSAAETPTKKAEEPVKNSDKAEGKTADKSVMHPVCQGLHYV